MMQDCDSCYCLHEACDWDNISVELGSYCHLVLEYALGSAGCYFFLCLCIDIVQNTAHLDGIIITVIIIIFFRILGTY